MSMKKYEFWFVVGSQFLYGPEVLETVAARAAEMAAAIHANPDIPCSFIFKGVVKTPDEATAIIKDANRCNACAGVVTWTHTFSPSKMWIQAFGLLQKPLCHFATQYNEALPDSIDMDFMNLNQAAHGDREHGFILARMRKPQKIVMGFWKDPAVLQELGNWMRSAVGFAVSQDLRVIRFGDNMRNVAVTEGDKIEAQMQLGWQVNTWPVGELAQTIREIPDAEVDARMASYGNRYEFATDDLDAVRYQARMEIAIRRFLKRENAGAFSNTFEDTGERIMTVTKSPLPTVAVCIAVVVVAALVFVTLKKRREQREREQKRAEEILKTPLEKFGDKEVEDLAKKYENQEKP